MSDVVVSSRDGAVLTLTLNRPEALNALNQEMTGALRAALETAAGDGIADFCLENVLADMRLLGLQPSLLALTEAADRSAGLTGLFVDSRSE